MPIYKSVADFFILTYIQTIEGLEVPFTYGNFEDFQKDKGSETYYKRVGYISSRRNPNQGLQSSYVNSALLKELISDNKLITIFQNAARLRSGKLSRQTHADMSIRWLLHAF